MGFIYSFKKKAETLLPPNFIYFFKKRIGINAFFWGKARRNIGVYYLNKPCKELPFIDVCLDRNIQQNFAYYRNYYLKRQDCLRTYILEVNDCIIEPKLGWAIDNNEKLVLDSIAQNTLKENVFPSYTHYKKEARTSSTKVDECISIRMIRGGEDNYWHFLFDLLGQVVVAKNYQLDHLPFIISKNLSSKKYFQDALKISSYLSSLKWIVQGDNEYISTRKAFFIQSQPHDTSICKAVLNLFDIKIADPKHRKIFIKRTSKYLRHLTNDNLVEEIVCKYGFEIVDTDDLSLLEQITLFKQTRYVIGIHGAGLINIMFRGSLQLSLLEIFPSDFIPPHYYWLSKDLGYGYLCQVGSAMNKKGGFSIDPVLFEEKVKQLINT